MVLELNLLKKIHKRKLLLKDINFTLNKGEILGIVGNNGAGKSTLLKALATLTKFEGQLFFLGEEFTSNNVDLKKHIGVLIEEPNLYEHITGIDYLKLILKYKGLSPNLFIERNMPFSFESFMLKKVSTYSLGMKQKLGILAATIFKPKLIVLDEPHNNLDPKSIIELRSYIKMLKDSGCTIIITSHVIGEIIYLCDNVLVINEGEITHRVRKSDMEDLESILVNGGF